MKSPPTRRPSSTATAGSFASAPPLGNAASGPAPSRQFHADLLKAAAIVGVVFIHADGILARPSWFHDVVGDLFRFGVPVFIALYVHFASSSMARRSRPGAYLGERFGRLLLQYVVWSAIYAGLTADWGAMTPLKFVTRHWSGNGWAGQYYFVIILQLTLVMPWIAASGAWFEQRKAALVVGSLLVCALLTYGDATSHPLIGKLSDRPFVYWLPYAWLGIVLMGRQAAASPPRRPAGSALLLIASVALIPIEHVALDPAYPLGSMYPMPSVFVATAALLHWARAHADAGAAAPGWLRRAVTLLSANTLGIFVLNPMVILLEHKLLATAWPDLAPALGGPVAAVVAPVLATAAALLPSLGVTVLMKRSAAGRRLVA